jgi:hypothetical protein
MDNKSAKIEEFIDVLVVKILKIALKCKVDDGIVITDEENQNKIYIFKW